MSELMGTINKLTKAVTQTSSTVIKSTKLNMSLANEEDNLKSVYIEVGKKVHEIYMFGGSLGKFFDEKYAEIATLEKKIDELKQQIDIVKGTVTCPKCNRRMERTAEFCLKCGYKLTAADLPAEPMPKKEPVAKDTSTHISEPVAEPIPEQKEKIIPKQICKICGGENPVGDKFCLSCGRIL